MHRWDSAVGRRRGSAPAGTRRPVGEFTDYQKTGSCEDAFAVLHVRRTTNLPAGRKPRYLKVSVSTELQNPSLRFNGFRLVTGAENLQTALVSQLRSCSCIVPTDLSGPSYTAQETIVKLQAQFNVMFSCIF